MPSPSWPEDGRLVQAAVTVDYSSRTVHTRRPMIATRASTTCGSVLAWAPEASAESMYVIHSGLPPVWTGGRKLTWQLLNMEGGSGIPRYAPTSGLIDPLRQLSHVAMARNTGLQPTCPGAEETVCQRLNFYARSSQTFLPSVQPSSAPSVSYSGAGHLGSQVRSKEAPGSRVNLALPQRLPGTAMGVRRGSAARPSRGATESCQTGGFRSRPRPTPPGVARQQRGTL